MSQQPPTKKKLAAPKTFAVVDDDGNYLRNAAGTLVRVTAFTRKSAKHTVRRMFGEGYEVGNELS